MKNYREGLYVESIKYYSVALPIFGRALGNLHHVSTDASYWGPIIGPWLLHFATVYTSRIEELQQSHAVHEPTGLVCHTPRDWTAPCYGWAQFIDLFPNDEFKESLSSQYLKALNGDCLNQPISSDHDHLLRVSLIKKTRNYISKAISRRGLILIELFAYIAIVCSQILYKNRVIYLDSHLLDTKTRCMFFFKSRGRIASIPKIQFRNWTSYLKKKPVCDHILRTKFKSLIDIPRESENAIFMQIASLNMPIAHLEDFLHIRNQARYLALRPPSVVMLNIGQYFDETLKCAIGEWLNHGTKIMVGQHGGGYGLLKFNSYEYYDFRLSSVFCTWGWTNRTARTRTLPSIRLSRFIENYHRINAKMPIYLYVCCTCPHFYSETLISDPQDNVAMRNGRSKFAEKCPVSLKAKVYIRPYPNNSSAFGSCDVSEFRSADFTIQENISYVEAYSSATILIFEGLSTGLFEALASDKPFVLYMPGLKQLPWSDLGRHFINLLVHGNMLFTSEGALVEFLQSDVDKWWLSDKTNSYRIQLKRQFAMTSQNFMDDWIADLFQLAAR